MATAATGGLSSSALRRKIENHLRYSVGKTVVDATVRDVWRATALAVREVVLDRWFETRVRVDEEQKKRVHYLSMEFLMGKIEKTDSNEDFLESMNS